jgi:hypothetical protein
LLADAMTIFKVVRYPTPEHRARMVRLLVILLPALSVALFLLWEKPVSLVFVGAVGQGLMLPFLGGAALYFRYKRTEPALAPGWLWTFCLWIAALSMAAAGVYQVAQEVINVVRS